MQDCGDYYESLCTPVAELLCVGKTPDLSPNTIQPLPPGVHDIHFPTETVHLSPETSLSPDFFSIDANTEDFDVELLPTPIKFYAHPPLVLHVDDATEIPISNADIMTSSAVKWDTDLTTWAPLQPLALDDPMTYSHSAINTDLLFVPGWTLFHHEGHMHLHFVLQYQFWDPYINTFNNKPTFPCPLGIQRSSRDCFPHHLCT